MTAAAAAGGGMESRIIEFIRGLRAAGVRVSLAESVDAMHAVDVLGIGEKRLFKESLRTTLVKEVADFAIFDELFPLYFSSSEAPLQNALEDMSADEQEMLRAALEAMSGNLQRLLDWLTSGEGPTKEELERLAEQAGANYADNQNDARWVTQRMLRQMGYGHLEEKLQELVEQLQKMGMSQEAIAKLLGAVDANREALAEQVAQQVGLQIAQQRANRPDAVHGSDLMYKSFENLSGDEMDQLRGDIQRLVTQLRSRAALRRKRGKHGKFDAKGTIRANLRHGGVPIELKTKKRKLKPSLVLICDVSNSMWSVAEFMLRFMNELNDQVSKIRSYAFYADLAEIDESALRLLRDGATGQAFKLIRGQLPGGSYGTNLGYSLNTFCAQHLGAVNGRTTIIVLGDGRNNYNSPRTDLVKDLQQRARRLIWFTPEEKRQWGTGDSDMWEYAPLCDSVHVVRNLAQLSAAVDKILTV